MGGFVNDRLHQGLRDPPGRIEARGDFAHFLAVGGKPLGQGRGIVLADALRVAVPRAAEIADAFIKIVGAGDIKLGQRGEHAAREIRRQHVRKRQDRKVGAGLGRAEIAAPGAAGGLIGRIQFAQALD